ncbi:MAG: HK97 gp10 family phage protein [Alphaproteobacteria bacterium]|nr:HK97 gp10 family phage protein [Alphaproteobacteria bacterium]
MAKFVGMENLRRKLTAVPVEIEKDVRRAIDIGAEEFANAARSAAPKGATGQLAKGIKIQKADIVKRGKSIDGAKRDNIRVRVVNEAFYARMVEHGHVQVNPRTGKYIGKVAGRATFYPAWNGLKKRIGTRILTASRTAAKRAWFK